MSLDFQAIRARNSLAEIASGYVDLRRIGGEMKGPCPICKDGDDRFTIFKSGDRFHCRQCEATGDVIDLVAKADGITIAEAAAKLGGESFRANAPKIAPRVVDTTPVPDEWRSPLWQEQANAILASAENCLEDSRAKAFLSKRAISLDICKRFRIGFSPEVYRHNTESKAPAIILPWRFPDGTITAVKYRFIDELSDQPDSAGRKNNRFSQKRGSKPLIFGLPLCDRRDVLIAVEGEFNCLAIKEVMLERADVLSIGPEKNREFLPKVAAHYDRVLLWQDEIAEVQKTRDLIRASAPTCKVVCRYSAQGKDANDWLVEQGAEALRETIEKALLSAGTTVLLVAESAVQSAAERLLFNGPYIGSDYARKVRDCHYGFECLEKQATADGDEQIATCAKAWVDFLLDFNQICVVKGEIAARAFRDERGPTLPDPDHFVPREGTELLDLIVAAIAGSRVDDSPPKEAA